MSIYPSGDPVVDPASGTLLTPARYEESNRRQPVDIAFVYCLDVEEDAVRQRFFASDNASARPYPPTYRRFYRNTHRHRGHSYQLVACKASDAGSLDMIAVLQDLNQHFASRVTCLIGIAGALDDRLELGDVLVADRVLWYERGKLSADGVTRELRHFELPPRVRNVVDAVLSDLRRDNNSPNAHWATFGTGEKVVASELADVRNWLVQVDRSVAAVEMESGGFFHHFKHAADRPDEQIWLVVKGVSDHADASKNDSRQPLAADNSARAALYIACAVIEEIRKASGTGEQR